MENETKKPTIIAAWNGVNYYKESGDDRADLPLEKYADEASEGGACSVAYCFNFRPPFARICADTRPKVAWGVAAYLMAHSCTDGRGGVSFFLNDEDVAGCSPTRLFSAYLAAARRVYRAGSTFGLNFIDPNKRGNIEKIAAEQAQWRVKHGEEEAAALERTRAADHGAAGELWREVEPIAEQYAEWLKGECVVDDEAVPVVAEIKEDEAEQPKRAGVKTKPFSDCVVDGTRAAEVTKKIHDLIAEKRGKDACIIIAGAMAAAIITRPSYKQFISEFGGDIIGKSTFDKYMSGFFSDEELAAVVRVFS